MNKITKTQYEQIKREMDNIAHHLAFIWTTVQAPETYYGSAYFKAGYPFTEGSKNKSRFQTTTHLVLAADIHPGRTECLCLTARWDGYYLATHYIGECPWRKRSKVDFFPKKEHEMLRTELYVPPYRCDKCGGVLTITHIDEDGIMYVEHCPHCTQEEKANGEI